MSVPIDYKTNKDWPTLLHNSYTIGASSNNGVARIQMGQPRFRSGVYMYSLPSLSRIVMVMVSGLNTTEPGCGLESVMVKDSSNSNPISSSSMSIEYVRPLSLPSNVSSESIAKKSNVTECEMLIKCRRDHEYHHNDVHCI